ncbi:MAG: hypothetical protein ACLTJ5_01440 [Clostridium sp.]
MYKSVLDYFEETVQRVPEKMAVRHMRKNVHLPDYRKRHKTW